MGVEIERKFLVDGDMFLKTLSNEDLDKGQEFFQGYLADDPWVRIRIIDWKEAELTIKGRGGLSRPEFNYPLPFADAMEMLPMIKGKLEKRRYHAKFGGFTWDVDEFKKNLSGLWLGEIELPAENTPFETPPWAVEEVTDDVRYTNAYLSKLETSPFFKREAK